MTYEAKRTTLGFELVGSRAGFPSNPETYELTPGEAFKIGDLVVIDKGKLTKADDSTENGVIGVMAETIEAADNPATAITRGRVHVNPLNVYEVSISDHMDVEATAGTTTKFTATGAFHADLVGAVIYVYEGPAAGEARISSGAHANYLEVSSPFSVAITDKSKAVVIGKKDDGPIFPGVEGVYAGADGDTLNAGKVPSAGPLTVLQVFPELLIARVVINRPNYELDITIGGG